MATTFRVGVVLQGGRGWIGGVEYTKNLLKALASQGDNSAGSREIIPLSATPPEPQLFADMAPGFLNSVMTFASREQSCGMFKTALKHLNLIADPTGLVAAAGERGIDVLFPHVRYPLDPPNVRSVAWIPDFQHCHYPHYFSFKERWLRDREYRRIERLSDCTVLSSEAARRDFVRFFSADVRRTALLRFTTVPRLEWFDADPAIAACRLNLPERFFLVCNQFWQHKNHRLVFEALHCLKAKGVRPTVVCTGNVHDHRRPGFAREIRTLIDNLGVSEQVILTGLIPRTEQILLLRRSLALVQPSLFEGWSTVVEDGRLFGKQIALSDIAVHREQAPPMGEYFDPADAEELAGILERWWSQLASGPDRDAEEAARLDNRRRVEQFAADFWSIMEFAAQTSELRRAV